MKTENNYRVYLRILSYLKPYVHIILLILFFNFSYVIFNTLSIWMVAPFISNIFYPAQEKVQQPPEKEIQPKKDVSVFNLNEWLKVQTERLFSGKSRVEMLKLLSILIFLSFLFKNVFGYAEAFWVSFVEQRVIKDLRDQVYGHMLYQPLHFFQKYQTGDLISRVMNDIDSLNVAVNRSFTKIIRNPVVIIIFLILLFNISWQLTLLAFVVIPLSGILIQKIGQSLKRKSQRVQERLADLTVLLQETLLGIKIVKAFSMEDYESNRFKGKTDRHFRAVLKRVRLNRLSSPLSETLGVGIMVTILWFGGQLVLTGKLISPEDFIRFIIILFSIMEPIKSLGQLNNNVQIAMASGNRVFEILDTPVTIRDIPNAIEKKDFEKNIVYKDVFFKYDENGAWVLKNINLDIRKNQKVALVGSSGAGKTTLVNLLPRFYDVTRGSILLDGTDIRQIKLADLRGLMGIVTQDVILFNDTVANNIAYGQQNYSLEKIEWAARLANAYDFIMEMPEGFNTMIGEQGVRLSGGQRQRLSIARAIMKNPPILIFDEATSSLDSESERLIQEAIENLMKNRTVLIIAHRLSSVINADKIVFIENGEILAEGTHEELLARLPNYRRLYELQFNIESEMKNE